MLRQNTNSGWSAVQGKHRLTPVVVDGWQQGWRVRPDDASVSMSFGPDRGYRVALAAGLALFALLALATLVMARRRGGADAPSLAERSVPAPVLGSLGALAGGLLAGWPGLVVGLLAVVGASVLNRRLPAMAPWLLGALVLPPALAYSFAPWGGEGTWAGSIAWPHYFVVAVVAVLCAGSLDVPLRVPRFFRRRPGFSTSR